MGMMSKMKNKMPGPGKKKNGEASPDPSAAAGQLAAVAQSQGGLGLSNVEPPVGIESGFAQVNVGGTQ